jgi:hypothetical protein
MIFVVRRSIVLNADPTIKGPQHSLFLACSIIGVEDRVGLFHREGTLTVVDAIAVSRELVVDD